MYMTNQILAQYAEKQVADAKAELKAKSDAKGKPLPESFSGLATSPWSCRLHLIRGVFPQTGVATIGGQSGSGKSFHAIHLSLCVIPDCEQYSLYR